MAQNTNRPVIEAKGLKVGEKINNFKAKDIYDLEYSLKNALSKGPVVVVFIRGQWCPFCNKHLSNLQDSLSLIYNKGASVVVISPEKSEFIKMSIEKSGAKFTLLYDEGYKISDLFDVTFKPDKTSLLMYNTILGAKLKESHSDNSERLPIPATYILDQNGIIVWKYFDRDYKKRSTVDEILRNLQ